MTEFLGKSASGPGAITIGDSPLGRGGEGSVYAITSNTIPGLDFFGSLVAKIYHAPNEGNRREKVIAMLQSPPDSSSVAWPLAILFDKSGMFRGYVMKRLENNDYQPWAILAHTKERKKIAPDFNVKYAITSARNLAVALHSVHLAGHRVGDINESNIFVSSDAKVLLVDTDSAQISARDTQYPCAVGKPEYTAPELSHGALAFQDRTIATDVFAYAVAVFQMLTGGAHPTDSVFNGEGDPPSTIEKIRQGIYPALGATNYGFSSVPRVSSIGIPSRLKMALLKALSVQPEDRLSLAQIGQLFDEIIENLDQCQVVKHHYFDRRDGSCGWCQHVANGQLDPWNPVTVVRAPDQASLPSIGFDQNHQPIVPQRAAPAVAGQTPQYAPPTGYSQGQQSSAQAPPASQPASPPEIPNKIKGKTVLKYSDGSYGVRPPLGIIFKQNPKLAISCFTNEIPEILKFWWPDNRKPPQLVSLGPGFILSWVLATLWVTQIVKLKETINVGFLPEQFYVICSMVAGIGAAFTGISLLVFGFLASLKNKKVNRGTEPPSVTILRFAMCSIFFGPLIIILGLLTFAYFAIEFITALIKSNSR